MKKENFKVGIIPAVLWGKKSDRLFIVVHGNMSHKEDHVIVIFSEEAVKLGYQVLGFDLPKHGERINENTLCKVQNCIQDLNSIMNYAKSLTDNVRVFACSMGAYFSLLAYKNELLQQSIFLSPVVNMKSIIQNMMKWFGITEDRLMDEKEIVTPVGEVLYWDYYSYVQQHPVVQWKVPTSILYGSEDDLCEFNIVSSFSKQFNCELEILKNGEHYFHTEEQLLFFRHWVKERLLINY